MPRYRVRRRIEQEATVLADNEHDAEDITQSLHELEAEYDFRKATPEKLIARRKELLN